MRSIVLILLVFFLNLQGLSQVRRSLKDTVFKPGDIITIPTLYLNGDAWLVVKGNPNASRPEERIDYTDSIQAIIDFIKSHKNLILEFAFHGNPTDPDSDHHNLEISKGFAYKVMMTFKDEYGISDEQVKTNGYGKAKPLYSKKRILSAKSKTERSRMEKANRRCELTVLEVR